MEYRKKIFDCEDDKFKEIVAKSKNYKNVVKLIFNDELLDDSKIGSISNRYRNDLLKKIKKLELDTSHFKEYTTKKVDLDEKLVENKKYDSTRLKELLYKKGIKEVKCEACGIGDIWDGLPLVLQLDHINGNSKDNRIENLRILCPNCHSQTNTYCTGQSFNPSCKPSKEQLLEDIKKFTPLEILNADLSIFLKKFDFKKI